MVPQLDNHTRIGRRALGKLGRTCKRLTTNQVVLAATLVALLWVVFTKAASYMHSSDNCNVYLGADKLTDVKKKILGVMTSYWTLSNFVLTRPLQTETQTFSVATSGTVELLMYIGKSVHKRVFNYSWSDSWGHGVFNEGGIL
jgi:hypothetical protein